ncbi:MAG TPA: DUF2127 domain-containing protein [Candidatus Saccharimonadales bacterium]|nr:DUF2127 domain-containing protein [Candidatus Saccharimonadales bacterium]
MPWFHPKTLLDKTYEIGIILKGLNGLLELTGGTLVLALSGHTISRITTWLTADALDKNPHNFIAVHVEHAGRHLASGQTTFAAAFLLTHGLLKVGLVTALLLNKHWAYPWALGVLGLFLVYQLFLLITSPGIGMALLTVIDIVILWLIWREWQLVKAKTQPAAEA